MKYEDFHFDLIEQKICIFVKRPDCLNTVEPRSPPGRLHRKSGLGNLGKDWNCQDGFVESSGFEMSLQGLTLRMDGI